ncbi:MAG: hypothetical protein P8N76_22230 [Pirellulaceae bacterium]|nr:hypothetical protein [Pirellulaceae bacterium]
MLLIDPNDKFFLEISDKTTQVTPPSPDWEDGDDVNRYFNQPLKEVYSPLVRLIDVSRHQRGKGLQKLVPEQLIDIANQVGESFAIVADPFVLKGHAPEIGAKAAVRKLLNHGYEPTQHWLQDCEKQRRRFASLGGVNTRFANATVSQPFQQFVDPSDNED